MVFQACLSDSSPLASGTLDPSPDQQLANCTRQMMSVLSSLGAGLHSLTHLKLYISALPPHLSSSQSATNSDKGIHTYFDPACQDDVAHVPATICAMLAAAVPNLQSLSLGGVCVDVALPVFGSSCPLLSSLQVEAVLVPLCSLEGINVWFPNMARFTIHTTSPGARQQCSLYFGRLVERYVNDALPLLYACSKLKRLQLDMNPKDRGAGHTRLCVVVTCTQQAWDSLPASLDEFECDTHVEHLLAATSFLHRIRSLALEDLPCNSLTEMLLQAPLLERLAITSEDPLWLMWQEDITPSELESLKAQFLRGFQLSCESFNIYGSCKDVQDLTAWLPPLLNTQYGTVVLTKGVVSEDLLDGLVHMCPALMSLVVKSQNMSGNSSVPVKSQLDEGILRPLVRLSCLQKLTLCLKIKYTMEGVISLCASLPTLDAVCFHRSNELSCDIIMEEMEDRLDVSFFECVWC